MASHEITDPDADPQLALPADTADRVWTAERIHKLGVTTDLTTAASIFQLSRSVAYDLAKHNKFPIEVLRFGTRYRVPVAAILQALHLPAEPTESAGPRPPT